MDFLENEIEEILNIFREESEEQIQKLNKNLLILESNPKDITAITELFREAHSIKGASRMIGLNDIQLIAHKLEDVFGMAKEHQLPVTPETIDILCKAVDFMSSIVEESIATRGKATFPQVQEIIQKIENIINSDDKSEDISDTQNNSNFDKFSGIKKFSSFEEEKTYKEAKTFVTQTKVNIEKVKIFSSNSIAIEELLYFVIQVNSLIKKFENPTLTEIIENIKIKLETSLRGSGVLTSGEINEIDENFEIFSSLFNQTNEVSPHQDLKNFPSPQTTSNNTYNAPADKDTTDKSFEFNDINTQKTNNNPELNCICSAPENNELTDDFKFIKNNISLFSIHSQENILKFDEIIEKINNFVIKIDDLSIKNIIEKIAELLVYSKEKDIPINTDIAQIIKESFETAVFMFNSPFEGHENPVLILQRIAVLQQMLKLSSSEALQQITGTRTDDDEENSSSLATINQNTEILNKKNISSGEISDGEKSLYETKPGDNNTIKTLRVDTKKLDQLVNQVGELIIAKIKAKDHLSELEKMIRSVEEWHRSWNKAKKHFRHFDKPYKATDLPAGTSIYAQNKNINVFFEENSIKLTGLMNKMNYLYKIIQEDDARLNLIVNELEERIKSVRVLPLATIFHMFPRMVRDIAREKNKNIELIISGSETSVDKKIIEEIKSPLIHIIRNSIDHGIEDSQTRIKNGKNPVGKIFLAAYHLENSVLIEIVDDGHGIDIESIKRKVLQKQLLTEEELSSMTEEQIMNIIFWSGFSTGETVTDISGRGIGLDIVYTKISQINGKVKIKSTLGEGCRVSIQLPVTMATIKSFLIEVNNQKFAIPTSTIKTTILISPENIFYKEGKKTIIVDNTTVPICNLSNAIDLPENQKKNKKLVVIVVQSEDVQVGFIVDKLIGDQEILHKNLSPPLLRVRNIAGVTTLGSGELCLILNIGDLVKSAYSKFGMTEKRITAEKTPTQDDLSEKHILVVDDSLTTRILERNILKSAGYRVTVAINGLDALTKIATEEFDLVVTDVEMPEINGFELTERLREQEKFKNLPIILVTSLVSEIDKRKGFSIGANAYLTKGNFNQDELLNTIGQLLNSIHVN